MQFFPMHQFHHRPDRTAQRSMKRSFGPKSLSITIGIDAIGQILVVVYNWRRNEIRLLSARKADRSERQQYLKK